MRIKEKGNELMKNKTLDVLNVTTNVINKLSGNLAVGVLLTNVFYEYLALWGKIYE